MGGTGFVFFNIVRNSRTTLFGFVVPQVIRRVSLRQGMGNPGTRELENRGIRELGNRGIRES